MQVDERRCIIAFVAFGAIASVLGYLAPEEEFLGASYKLVYLHLPLLYISLGSFYLAAVFGILSVRRAERIKDSYALALAALPFALANMVVVYFFERAAWGAFSASEPRFYFLLISYGMLAVLLLLHQLRERALIAFASALFLASDFLLYFRLRVANTWQLHPERVGMPIEMRLPLLFSLAAFLCIYLLIFQRMRRQIFIPR